MPSLTLWLMLFVAIATGWLLGLWSARFGRRPNIDDEATLRERLQFLFTNYSDEAIESFVETLAVSQDTVNLHLSIGAHFRNKGEVDRATLIHQNLLARTELPGRYSYQVTYELAMDYLAAGLLDRAESLLHELMGSREYGRQSAQQLIELYQQERDWEKAVQVAVTLVEAEPSPARRKQLAYLLCERAEQDLARDDRFTARNRLSEALGYDPACIKALLLLADMHQRDNKPKDARLLLLSIFDQKPAFAPEAVKRLMSYARENNSEVPLAKKLRKLYYSTPSTSLLLAMVELEYRRQGEEAAIALLQQELSNRPSLRGLLRLIEMNGPEHPGSGTRDGLVSRVGELLIENKPVYQCTRCGFSGHQLHWLCPSCKTWESVEPVQGVDGE